MIWTRQHRRKHARIVVVEVDRLELEPETVLSDCAMLTSAILLAVSSSFATQARAA
jgi:hypothetical protein